MDVETLKNYVSHSWDTLSACWPEKLLVGSLGAAFQLHAELMVAFTILREPLKIPFQNPCIFKIEFFCKSMYKYTHH